jgi:hypothetical protein
MSDGAILARRDLVLEDDVQGSAIMRMGIGSPAKIDNLIAFNGAGPWKHGIGADTGRSATNFTGRPSMMESATVAKSSG